MLGHFIDLYAYNRWAHERVLDAAEPVALGDLRRPLGASYGSLFGTLVHLYTAEFSWLARWLGTPLGAVPDVDGVDDVPALRGRWNLFWPRQDEFLQGLTEPDLSRPVTIRTRTGFEAVQTLGATLTHVANHATYHRGQVTSLLRQLCVEPVATDYLLYYDAHGKAKAASLPAQP